ncbi:MAG: phosphoesterase, partial [Christensenella sp.]
MIYFTSDFHFGHKGIIEMQNRPFSCAEEMNETLIRNYNERVHKNDTVYILGDISHHMRIENTEG